MYIKLKFNKDLKTRIVKNITCPPNEECKCGSWLKYWENISGEFACFCAAYGCKQQKNLVGAQVEDAKNEGALFIIPLCEEHSEEKDDLPISMTTTFVPFHKN